MPFKNSKTAEHPQVNPFKIWLWRGKALMCPLKDGGSISLGESPWPAQQEGGAVVSNNRVSKENWKKTVGDVFLPEVHLRRSVPKFSG